LIDTGTGDSLKKHILAGEKEVNNLIVNGFCITAVLSLLISFFLYCFTYFIPTTQDVNKNSLIIVFAMSFLVMPFKICREVLSSYQKTYIHSVFLIIFTIMGTLYFLLFNVKSPVQAVIAQQASIVLGNVGCMIYLLYRFNFKFTDISISLRQLSRLFPDSARFFIIGLSLMIINGIDLLLLDSFGAQSDDITEVSLILKICIYMHTFFMFVIYPSWPLLNYLKRNEALKYKKVKLFLSFFIVIGGAIVSIILYLLYGRIISYWTNVDIKLQSEVAAGFILFTYFRLLADYIDYFLRSENIFQIQAISTFAEALFHIILGYVGWCFSGVLGFSLSLPLSTIICRILPYLITYSKNREALKCKP
ncbi:TPA: hypothetical protein R3U63_004640, partial [Escherichia coli]|nr:hypothetical protein [Escherichia coli]